MRARAGPGAARRATLCSGMASAQKMVSARAECFFCAQDERATQVLCVALRETSHMPRPARMGRAPAVEASRPHSASWTLRACRCVLQLRRNSACSATTHDLAAAARRPVATIVAGTVVNHRRGWCGPPSRGAVVGIVPTVCHRPHRHGALAGQRHLGNHMARHAKLSLAVCVVCMPCHQSRRRGTRCRT